MSQSAMEAEMERAFSAWAMYSRLKFTQVSPVEDADITVLFGYKYHRDQFPFDGPGGVLAHAFYPYERTMFSGEVHFDEEEPWVVNATADQLGEGMVDFYRVAVHELGHSLGLGHSHVTSSIMFPYYQNVNGGFVLGDDDVRAMHELYVSRTLEDDNETTSDDSNPNPSLPPPRLPPPTTPRTTTSTPRTTRPYPYPTRQPPRRRTTATPRRTTTTTTTTTTQRTNLTFEGDYETVHDHKEHDKHVHGPECGHGNGNHHGHHHNHDHGYDQRPGSHPDDDRPVIVEGNEDTDTKNESTADICSGSFGAAALLRGELFVFKGTHLWRLRERGKVMPGYPALITAMFRELPVGTVIDAAYQRPTDGSIVLFTGNKLWVYTGSTFIEDSPRPLSHVDLPSDLDRIDAAMVWSGNGATYFFRREQFWRFNETTREVDQGYPQLIKMRWKGMPSNIDAALSWKDGRSFFFKDSQYWEFDSKKRASSPLSPQPAVTYWLGC